MKKPKKKKNNQKCGSQINNVGHGDITNRYIHCTEITHKAANTKCATTMGINKKKQYGSKIGNIAEVDTVVYRRPLRQCA